MTALGDLRSIRDQIAHVDALSAKLRAERIRLAGQLRDEGVDMRVIAAAAGVSDSYLARILIRSGARRRRTVTPWRR